MASPKLSDCFKINFTFLKIFGIWPDTNASKYYKFYMVLYLFINSFIYYILLILNLLFTPRKIELLIKEVIFLFTEVAVTSKVLMILLMRKKLIDAFDILNCGHFEGKDDVSKLIIKKHIKNYKTWWKVIAISSNFGYISKIFLPIFLHSIFNTNMELPICKYYFLDDEVVRSYFAFWFIYQSIGMYGHMQYNVNIDTLIAGFLIMAIAQVNVIKHELETLKVSKDSEETETHKEALQILRLNYYLRHYEKLLNFCSTVQDIIGITIFVQFGMASVIICVVLCGLLLPSSFEITMFMVSYLISMVLQIFVPCWFGTQLVNESQNLVFAAYNSEWIPRCKRYKQNLNLFMQRSNTNIVFSGWNIFTLSLDTFVSILKTAYSFFTLIRNVQDRETE